MPHLVIEYSSGALDKAGVTRLMERVFQAAGQSGVMKPEDIKVRARAYDDFLVAGAKDSFVHLTAYLLAGRTSEQKVRLSEQLRATLVDLCPDVISLSVDVSDMDPLAYKKRLR
jgi:5-carboxymethyl-2-hydroxymuconate isomerase